MLWPAECHFLGGLYDCHFLCQLNRAGEWVTLFGWFFGVPNQLRWASGTFLGDLYDSHFYGNFYVTFLGVKSTHVRECHFFGWFIWFSLFFVIFLGVKSTWARWVSLFWVTAALYSWAVTAALDLTQVWERRRRERWSWCNEDNVRIWWEYDSGIITHHWLSFLLPESTTLGWRNLGNARLVVCVGVSQRVRSLSSNCKRRKKFSEKVIWRKGWAA